MAKFHQEDAETRGRKSQGFETPTESLIQWLSLQAGSGSPSEFFLRVSPSGRPRVLEFQKTTAITRICKKSDCEGVGV